MGRRVNDVLSGATVGPLPPGITLNGGNSLLLSGVTTKGLNFSDSNSLGLNTFGGDEAMAARMAGLEKIVTFDSGLRLVASANAVLADSIRSAREINAALGSAPPLPVAFPNSGLGNQLAEAARLMSIRGALGNEPADLLRGDGRLRSPRESAPAGTTS